MGKYEHVYQDLREKIEDGTYAVGSLLPSENQLTKMYGVSRETARKALAILTNRGFIQKIKGKGSVVINHSHYALPVSELISYKELTSRTPGKTRSEIFALEHALIPRAPFKDLEPDLAPTEATFIGRIRYIDGEPAIIDRDYILTSIVPKVPFEAASNSLYEYLEKDLNLPIAYSSKVIKIEPATATDRDFLKLTKGEYVAVTISVTCLEDTRAIQYTESRHRADKFVYKDFARRQ